MRNIKIEKTGMNTLGVKLNCNEVVVDFSRKVDLRGDGRVRVYTYARAFFFH